MRLTRTGPSAPAVSRIATFTGGAIAIVWVLLTGAGLTAAAIVTDDAPPYRTILDRSARIMRSEKFLLAPNPEITAAEAGAIFHRITFGGLSENEIARYRVRPVAANLPYRAPDSLAAVPDLERVRNHPVAGALLAQIPPMVDLPGAYRRVAALTVLPDGTDLIGRLAGARHIDLLGARLPSPLPAHLTYDEIPLIRPGAWREIAYVRLAEIARAIAEDRLADAHRMSREMITIAFVWHREAPTYYEVLNAAFLNDSGLQGMAATAAARGDTDIADEIRTSFETRAEPHPLLQAPQSWGERLMSLRTSRVLEIARDPELPRAVAVDYAMFYHVVRPCFVYPLFTVRAPLSETLRPHIMHYDSEAQWYEKLTAPQPSRSILEWPEKAADCAQLFTQIWL